MKAYALDLRALAALRILLGLVVLLDLALRARDLVAHYTDFGVLPGVAFEPAVLQRWIGFFRLDGRFLWSFYDWGGTPLFAGMMFVATATAAFAMALGYRSRLAAVVTWVLVSSLHTRNPLVVNAGDTELRLLLFWCMFLPIGACWSLDEARPGRGESGAVASWASAALIVQIGLVYLVTAWLKTGRAWLQDGDAVHYAMHLAEFARTPGIWLRQFPMLTHAAAPITLAVEWACGLAIVVPWGQPRVRACAAVVLAALHVGIACTLQLGLFPLISIVALVALIPGEARTAVPEKAGLAAVLVPPLLACVAAWNVGVIMGKPHIVPLPARAVVEALRLDQFWSMFAPKPPRASGFFAYSGAPDVDVGLVDPRAPAEPPSASFRNDRWRKHYLNLADERLAVLREFTRAYAEQGRGGLRLTYRKRALPEGRDEVQRIF